MQKEILGTLVFSNPVLTILWRGELAGQISDGMWENSRPYNHWQFWHQRDVRNGLENKLTLASYARPRKTNYAFTKLLPIIGDRMLNLGRMAKAFSFLTYAQMRAAEHMPETFEQWISKNWLAEPDFIKNYMLSITAEMAQTYYNTTYTMKELRADLKTISNTMKNYVSK